MRWTRRQPTTRLPMKNRPARRRPWTCRPPSPKARWPRSISISPAPSNPAMDEPEVAAEPELKFDGDLDAAFAATAGQAEIADSTDDMDFDLGLTDEEVRALDAPSPLAGHASGCDRKPRTPDRRRSLRRDGRYRHGFPGRCAGRRACRAIRMPKLLRQRSTMPIRMRLVLKQPPPKRSMRMPTSSTRAISISKTRLPRLSRLRPSFTPSRPRSPRSTRASSNSPPTTFRSMRPKVQSSTKSRHFRSTMPTLKWRMSRR